MSAIADERANAEQREFVAAFLAENVRVAADVGVSATTIEQVPFTITVQWQVAPQPSQIEQSGHYKGTRATVFVDDEGALDTETERYLSGDFEDEQAVHAALSTLSRMPDFGLRQTGSVKLRDDSAEFVWVRMCDDCDGAGKTRCRGCGGAGMQRCPPCRGNGRQTCSECSGSGSVSDTQLVHHPDRPHETEVIHRQCGSCSDGTVSCSNCRGSGEQRCRPCRGSGEAACTACAQTGALSVIRRMTLVADAARAYAFDPTVSSTARQTFERIEPGLLPPSAFTGTWSTTSDVAHRPLRITFSMSASTRVLASTLHIGDEQFPFVTYGASALHVATGGGIVEHLLEHDRAELARAVETPLAARILNPVGSIRALVDATNNVLASKVHQRLFTRHTEPHVDDVAESVSEAYKDEIITGIRRAFGMIDRGLTRSVWVLAALVTFVIMLPRLGVLGAPARLTASTLHLGYPFAFAAAGLAALTSLLAQMLTVTLFSSPERAPVLRGLLRTRAARRIPTWLAPFGMTLLILLAMIVVGA